MAIRPPEPPIPIQPPTVIPPISNFGGSSTTPSITGTNDAGGIGVSGLSQQGVGLYGKGGKFAGQFDGNLQVNGTATITGSATMSGGATIAGPLTCGNVVRVGNQVAFRHTIQQQDLFPQYSPSTLNQELGQWGAVLDYQSLNGQANALIFITPLTSQVLTPNTQDQSPGMNGPAPASNAFGVMYGAYPPPAISGEPYPPSVLNKWLIIGSVAVGQQFNVLVLFSS
jgi:hypothetical protein